MYTENDLLIYCWKHRLFGTGIRTLGGLEVEVVDQGLYNRHDGPTFFNAKVKIAGTLWVGNVECMTDTEEWYYRNLHADKRYDNVILVVCLKYGPVPINSQDKPIAMAQVAIPDNVRRNAKILMGFGGDYLCRQNIYEYTTPLMRHAWLAAMQTEWLENVIQRMRRYHTEESMSILQIAFNQILRGFGFVTNETAMDLLARAIPVDVICKHVDDTFQIEAIIFGQAGLLVCEDTVQDALLEKCCEKAFREGYFTKLRNEWLYLKHKHSMPNNLSRLVWKPYGRGALSYPHVHLSMLVQWLYMNFYPGIIERITSIKSAKEAQTFFNSHVTPYWEMHNHFGLESTKCMKSLSDNRRSYLTTAVIVPFMFFYGQIKDKDEYCDRAFDIMEQTKAFSTSESSYFTKHGLGPTDAAEAISLTHLHHEYCQKHDCLRCRFGFEFIKKHQ